MFKVRNLILCIVHVILLLSLNGVAFIACEPKVAIPMAFAFTAIAVALVANQISCYATTESQRHREAEQRLRRQRQDAAMDAIRLQKPPEPLALEHEEAHAESYMRLHRLAGALVMLALVLAILALGFWIEAKMVVNS